MKKIKNKNRKKNIIIAAIVLVTVLTGGAVFAYNQKVGPFKETGNKPVSTSDKDTFVKKTENKSSENDTKKDGTPVEPSLPDTDIKKNVSVNIIGVDNEDTTMRIRTMIDTIDTNGKCTLVIGSISKISDVVDLPSSSKCDGFILTKNELTAGTYQANLSFSSDHFTGSTIQTIRVQ